MGDEVDLVHTRFLNSSARSCSAQHLIIASARPTLAEIDITSSKRVPVRIRLRSAICNLSVCSKTAIMDLASDASWAVWPTRCMIAHWRAIVLSPKPHDCQLAQDADGSPPGSSTLLVGDVHWIGFARLPSQCFDGSAWYVPQPPAPRNELAMLDISLRGRSSPISDFPSGGIAGSDVLLGLDGHNERDLHPDHRRRAVCGFRICGQSGDTALGVGFHQRYFEGAQAGASEGHIKMQVAEAEPCDIAILVANNLGLAAFSSIRSHPQRSA